MTRHLLRDDDLSPAEQAEVLALAARMKSDRFGLRELAGPRTVALLFDKPTLRTQVSFATGIAELGGFPAIIDSTLAQIGERESIADSARVLTRQVAAIVWRTHDQSRLQEMADHVDVPVVNGLTDQFHPCQLLADLLTLTEHRGSLPELRLTFLGDGASNMSHSYLLAGATAGLHVRISSPDGFEPDAETLDRARDIALTTGGSVAFVGDPKEAVEGADAVATDTWVSMGKESEAERRAAALAPYSVNAELLAATADAVVLHCLPAHRGREITAEVLDGPSSVVWDQAENRLHVQKALLAWLLTAGRACRDHPTGRDHGEGA